MRLVYKGKIYEFKSWEALVGAAWDSFAFEHHPFLWVGLQVDEFFS